MVVGILIGSTSSSLDGERFASRNDGNAISDPERPCKFLFLLTPVRGSRRHCLEPHSRPQFGFGKSKESLW